MQALSGLDASFLYLENEKMPMHIGGVLILEGSLAFATFKSFLQDRIHSVDKLTQKLVTIPMSLDRPYWSQDENFNIDNHLHHTALPAPGGWQELRYLASRIFSQPLDRSRPLWEFIFVEGLTSIPQVPVGSVAIITRVHHAAFDGKSGAELMSMLFDVSPTPKSVPPMPDKAPEELLPSAMNLLGKGAMNLVSRTGQLPSLLWDTGKATLRSNYLKRIHGIKLPSTPFKVPRTRFNGTVEAGRKWNAALLDFKRVSVLRKAVEGATVNDVILTICAGALRRFLDEKDELPESPMVAMVPVSTRTESEKNAMGNQVSAMAVQLATDVANPLQRLERIHLNTMIGKLYQDAIDAKSLMGYAELVPFGLAGVAARMYTRTAMAKMHRPLVNVAITNVPGPQVPLYLAGHKLLANMGTAPIYDGLGMIITITSYNGVIAISPTSSLNLMPDLDVFTKYLRESANELEEHVNRRMAAEATIDELLKGKNLESKQNASN